MGRADLHFHLLPGVDDGPSTMDEALDLARAAVAEGTRAIVATPHVRPDQLTDVGELPGRVDEVCRRLAASDVDVTVHCGGELGHDIVGRLGQADLETIAQGPAGARWVLLESPFEGLTPEFSAAADELRDRGFGIVLAHPERSAGVMAEGAPALTRELALGTILQVNTWSLSGAHGSAAQDAGEQLLRDGRVGLLASDAHPGWRAPALTMGVALAVKLGLSELAAGALTDTAPARLLHSGVRPGAEEAVAA